MKKIMPWLISNSKAYVFLTVRFLDLWGNKREKKRVERKVKHCKTIFFHRPISGSFHVSLIILSLAVVAVKRRALIDDTNENVPSPWQLKFEARRH